MSRVIRAENQIVWGELPPNCPICTTTLEEMGDRLWRCPSPHPGKKEFSNQELVKNLRSQISKLLEDNRELKRNLPKVYQ
jgi:tRNA(Ile2) C34 agmatinyltransferase TiaS